MRPGNKIPSGQRSFRHKPLVEPPGALRIVSALSILSIVGVLVYSVFIAIFSVTASGIDPEKGVYVAVLHFMLPFGVAYTVSTNNRLSRYILVAYFVLLYVATMSGKGFLGELQVEFLDKALLSTTGFALAVFWLFGSAKMRYYYALISDRPIPPDLESRAQELAGKNWPGPRTKAAIEWVADHMETVVLIGFTVVAVFSCVDL